MSFKLKHLLVCFMGLLLWPRMLSGNEPPLPSARYSFNNTAADEISGRKCYMQGITYSKDRFNNDNYAVYLFGNQSSFVSLGAYKNLKPAEGTISLWLKMGSEIWSGQGHKVNPILLTKLSNEDDFYESYAIYYQLESDNIAITTTQDSTKQLSIVYTDFTRNDWYHIAFSYNFDSISVYVNGKRAGQLAKGYQTRFCDTDSVLLGITANKKNRRYYNGSIDDLEFYDRVLTPTEIEQIYNAPNPNRNKIILRYILYAGGLTLLVLFIYLFVRYQLSLTLKKEKQTLELYNLQLETELRVNRALMNPHFVFNSLNALQNFILTGENDVANNYLVKFSRLMRKILESNMSEVISLEQELALLKGYLEIEDLRFEENIKTEIVISPDLVPSAIHIPIMMIQPFVENAIWHGLLKKQGEKHLRISFSMREKNHLECVIEDNGIGRPAKPVGVEGKSSLATVFVMQRLELLNKIHDLSCGLEIADKPHNGGTIVTIILPILGKKS